jgi:DNA polymerase-3 subunit chi
MTQIQFYHLTATPLDRALPKLLEKIVSAGYRVALTAADEDHVEALNQCLWTYDPASFLPHGSVKDGHPDAQPVLISTDANCANQANLLFVTDGRMAEGDFERVVDMFDGGDEHAVASAHGRWTNYKNAGGELAYFKQTAQGNWEKAA